VAKTAQDFSVLLSGTDVNICYNKHHVIRERFCKHIFGDFQVLVGLCKHVTVMQIKTGSNFE